MTKEGSDVECVSPAGGEKLCVGTSGQPPWAGPSGEALNADGTGWLKGTPGVSSGPGHGGSGGPGGDGTQEAGELCQTQATGPASAGLALPLGFAAVV